MAAGRRSAAAGAALVVLLIGSPTDSDASPDLTVVVHVEDHVRLPEKDLHAVKKEVDKIFGAAGVIVSWAGPLHRPVSEVTCDGLRHVAVAIINIQTTFDGAARDTADVLGRAAPALARAWVFVNRVREIAKDRPVDANLVLGRAIAHELGHLLLPAQTTHGTVGIMRQSLELVHVGLFRFTSDESNMIRAALASAYPHAQRGPSGRC